MINTKRLLIRRWTLADLDAWAAIQGDRKTMAFWPAPFTREDSRGWIERALGRYATHGYGRMAVLDRASGRLIGDCGVTPIELDGEAMTDIGWIIARPYWGRGLAVEAAEAVRDHAFATLGIEAIHANMAWNHATSAAVAERIGMRKVREFDNPRNRNIRTLLYELRADGR